MEFTTVLLHTENYLLNLPAVRVGRLVHFDWTQSREDGSARFIAATCQNEQRVIQRPFYAKAGDKLIGQMGEKGITVERTEPSGARTFYSTALA